MHSRHRLTAAHAINRLNRNGEAKFKLSVTVLQGHWFVTGLPLGHKTVICLQHVDLSCSCFLYCYWPITWGVCFLQTIKISLHCLLSTVIISMGFCYHRSVDPFSVTKKVLLFLLPWQQYQMNWANYNNNSNTCCNSTGS